MSQSVFYNFFITNDGDVEIPVDKTDTPYTELLPKASNYGVSVIKFTLPNEAETFRIVDTSYNVTLLAPLPFATIKRVEFTTPMPTRDQFKIRCIADFLECLNRTLIKTHNSLLIRISTLFPSNVPRFTPTNILTANFATNQIATVTFSDAQVPRASRYSYLECGFRISTTAFPRPAAPNLQVFLVNPAGVSINLTANRQLAFDETGNTYYRFSDAVLLQDVDTLDPLPLVSAPLEPFSKLLTSNETSTTGLWSMVFQYSTIYTGTTPSTALQFAMQAFIDCIASPAYSTGVPVVANDSSSYYPYIAPAFSFDNSSKTVSMILQDRTPVSGYSMLMSPKLFRVMPFPGKLVTVPVVNTPLPDYTITQYLITIPQSAYSANTEPAIPDTFKGTLYRASIYPAPNPNDSYKLLDIRTVIIKTNLMTQAEQENTTNSRILMSLDVTGSDYFSNLYQFASNNVNTRTYHILDDGPLTRLGISVFYKYRTTGELVQAMLPPNTTFTLLLKFSPNGTFA